MVNKQAPMQTETDEENFVLSVVRLNKKLSKKEIRVEVQIRRLNILFSWRSRKNLWGRFGGGWQWKLGFQASSRTIIFSLLIAELTVSLNRKKVN